MKFLLSVCFLYSVICTSYAQPPHLFENVQELIADPLTGSPSFIRLKEYAAVNADRFTSWSRDVLGMQEDEKWELIRTETDQLGITHHRYQLMFKGFPVSGAIYIAHSRHNKLISANGRYIPSLEVNTSISLMQETALQTAGQYIGGNATVLGGELLIAPYQGNINGKDFRLCYRFDAYAVNPLRRAYLFIDAQTGEVICELDRIHTSDSSGTAVTKYKGTRSIKADWNADDKIFLLKESGRGGGIGTMNLANNYNKAQAFYFQDGDNYWNNVNAEQDEVAGDVHWGTERVYDYYMEKHERNSFDNKGAALTSYVHYGSGYVNAFWDGETMTYGDGDGSTFTPLTTLDICGHELTHGVTEFSAGLIYANEPGALNEAFSDIFGTAIEFYADPAQANWLIGENCTVDGRGLRSMSDPKDYGHPDTYKGTNWITGPWDNGGVHTNSSVANYWFYLLAAGGSGINDYNYLYATDGIGIAKAEKIAYRLLAYYLTPYSGFEEAAVLSKAAASDLFGYCAHEVIQVDNAWRAVGVIRDEQLTAIFRAEPTDYCKAPAPVKFTNLSQNAVEYIWDFGDGTTSSETSPLHNYMSQGLYTVQLIARSCAGLSDTITLTDYIYIDPVSDCRDTIYANTAILPVQTRCNGVLFDGGGPSGPYENNSNTFVLIDPVRSSRISVTFKQFELGAGDQIEFKIDQSAWTLKFSALTPPPLNIPIIMPDNSVMVHFSADGAIPGPGFEMAWECEYVLDAPALDTRSAFTLYPNPASGTIFIQYDRMSLFKRMEIYNLVGTRLVKNDLDPSAEMVQQDISDLPDGMYLVRMISDAGSTDKKLVVIR